MLSSDEYSGTSHVYDPAKVLSRGLYMIVFSEHDKVIVVPADRDVVILPVVSALISLAMCHLLALLIQALLSSSCKGVRLDKSL